LFPNRVLHLFHKRGKLLFGITGGNGGSSQRVNRDTGNRHSFTIFTQRFTSIAMLVDGGITFRIFTPAESSTATSANTIYARTIVSTRRLIARSRSKALRDIRRRAGNTRCHIAGRVELFVEFHTTREGRVLLVI